VDKTAQVTDLGPVRLERRDGFITLTPAFRHHWERGFSLLIKEPGFYTLKGKIHICVKDRSPSGSPEELPSGKTGLHAVFYAQLPLVFRNHQEGDCIYRGGRKRRFSDILDNGDRSKYTGVITACGAEGPAAFIAIGIAAGNDGGRDLLVLSGDVGSANTGGLLFEISL
jgi:hypothetical protein